MLQGIIQGHTDVFGPPDSWDSKQDGHMPCLYIRRGKIGRHNSISSSFHPTPAELEAMTRGAPVHLTILSDYQPPVRLTVAETPDSWIPFPKAVQVLSCESHGHPESVVIQFPRTITNQEIERLRRFFTQG